MSSNVDSSSYDKETKTLTVTFARSGSYEYTGVPSDVAAAFAASPSQGKFVHDQLSSYSYTRS